MSAFAEPQVPGAGPSREGSRGGLAASVIARLAEAVVVCDLDARIVLFNAAAERLYGLPARAVLGRPAGETLVHPGGRPQAMAWPPEGGGRAGFETATLAWHRRSDGTPFDAEIRVSAVRDGDGTLCGFAVLVRDVTEHLAEHGRASSLRSHLEAAAIALVGVDRHDAVTLVNPAAERLFGWPADEMVGRAIWSVVGAHAQLRDPELAARVRAGRTVDLETMVRRRDGRYVAVRIRASARLAPDGAYDGAVVSAVDLSGRRHAEREADSARLQALVGAAADAIISSDPQGRIATWNPGAERMFGLPTAQAIGRRYADIVPDGDRPVLDELHEQLRDGQTVTVRMGGRRADGTEFPTEVSAAPLRRLGNGWGGAVTIVRDITALAEAELDLRERAAQLERSNADLEQFAYAASHDLQEPLRSLALGAETLLLAAGDRLEEDERRLLTTMERSVTQMSEQVTALMRLAQVAVSKEPGEPVPVALALEDALAATRAAVREAGAEIDVRGLLPASAVPRAELALVLQNLIANAISYRRPDVAPRIVIRGERDGGHVVLRVADNGIGLTESDRGRIFGLFERAHPGVSGTGLGLALCRRILGRRSGSISVASAGPGRGSEFTVRLPATADDPPR